MASFDGRYECKNGTSNKFYEIHEITSGKNKGLFHCAYGPIGSSGSEIIYSFDKVIKKVNNFNRKGYIKVNSGIMPSKEKIDKTEIDLSSKNRLALIAEEDVKLFPNKKSSSKIKSRLNSIEEY